MRTPDGPHEGGAADGYADPEHAHEDGDERGDVEREEAVPEHA